MKLQVFLVTGKRDVLATFIAQNYDLAMKHFTNWILDWLMKRIILSPLMLVKNYNHCIVIMNTWTLDGVFYSFRENNNNEKFQFNCPHCGGHKVFGEKVSQWMRMDVTGIDEDGFVCYDYENASFCADEEDDPDFVMSAFKLLSKK